MPIMGIFTNIYINLRKTWQRFLTMMLVLLLCNGFMTYTPAVAANLSGDLSKQQVTEIAVSLGNTANELKFEPNHLEFEAGRRYKLKLNNPSAVKHYFTAKDFADAIWTQKVEAGKVEVKGAIHEVELKPGAVAESGMTGDIVIQPLG